MVLHSTEFASVSPRPGLQASVHVSCDIKRAVNNVRDAIDSQLMGRSRVARTLARQLEKCHKFQPGHFRPTASHWTPRSRDLDPEILLKDATLEFRIKLCPMANDMGQETVSMSCYVHRLVSYTTIALVYYETAIIAQIFSFLQVLFVEPWTFISPKYAA